MYICGVLFIYLRFNDKRKFFKASFRGAGGGFSFLFSRHIPVCRHRFRHDIRQSPASPLKTMVKTTSPVCHCGAWFRHEPARFALRRP